MEGRHWTENLPEKTNVQVTGTPLLCSLYAASSLLLGGNKSYTSGYVASFTVYFYTIFSVHLF